MAVDVWTVKVGDKVREAGCQHVLTVWRINPAGSASRARRHGPSISAHIRPGGYSTSFDAESAHRFEKA